MVKLFELSVHSLKFTRVKIQLRFQFVTGPKRKKKKKMCQPRINMCM